MINKIKNEINQALLKLNLKQDISYAVEKSKDLSFGDFSSNIAMVLSKEAKKNPMVLAEEITSNLDKSKFNDVFVTKPGFINFKMNDTDKNQLIKEIQDQKESYPTFKPKDLLYNIEFVSANPTGYLHIGHARNAVFGDTLNRLLNKVGIKTIKEYLVNDAGNQMNRLAYSTLVRYKQLFNENIELCEDSYHGQEIKLIAEALKEKYGDKFVSAKIVNDEIENDEVRIELRNFSGKYLLDVIKQDLALLDVKFDLYFSENNDHAPNAVDNILKKLKDYVYQKEGATWLKTTLNGDDKDRVLVKSDGSYTYFLPDIVYHEVKVQRNHPNKLINIWGADHHNYILRMETALKFLGYNNIMDVVCMQMVRLMKNGAEFKLSKRTGNAFTLRELVETIGAEPSRWFLLASSPNSHIDIDIDVALSKDVKNPIYYVQYAHARANTLLSKVDNIPTKIDTSLLTMDQEKEMINLLSIFKETIEYSALNYEPFKLCNYLTNLSKIFHNYYSNVKILNEDNLEIKNQRIILINSIKTVISNGLNLLGIKASIRM